MISGTTYTLFAGAAVSSPLLSGTVYARRGASNAH